MSHTDNPLLLQFISIRVYAALVWMKVISTANGGIASGRSGICGIFLAL